MGFKFVYHGHEDGEKVRIDCGTFDSHGRPLTGHFIVPVDTDVGKRMSFVIESGKPFTIDETEPAMDWIISWMRSQKRVFQLLSDNAPVGTKAGAGNSH